jgi:ABC-type sugar transport system ATPase subunit
MQVREGDALAIFGLKSAGRSGLARIVFELDPHSKGAMALDGAPLEGGLRERIAPGMAFVTEDHRAGGLLMDSPMSENMGLVSFRRYRGGRSPLSARRMLEGARAIGDKLRLKAADEHLSQPTRSLSGGHQQQVVIVKWLTARPAPWPRSTGSRPAWSGRTAAG